MGRSDQRVPLRDLPGRVLRAALAGLPTHLLLGLSGRPQVLVRLTGRGRGGHAQLSRVQARLLHCRV